MRNSADARFVASAVSWTSQMRNSAEISGSWLGAKRIAEEDDPVQPILGDFRTDHQVAPSGPDSLRSTSRSVSSISRFPVVPVAISSYSRSWSSFSGELDEIRLLRRGR